MNILDRDTARLIVEAGIAATNHHLPQEAESILAALPCLVPELSTRNSVKAILLFGLGRPIDALASLATEQSDEALALGHLIQGTVADTPATTPSAVTPSLTQLATHRRQ